MRRSSLSLTALALIVGACARDPITSSPVAARDVNPHVIGEVCDFITFGRLIVEDDAGNMIVISGNAGGNAPGGGILGEVEIHANGTTYHVHTVDQYGPPLIGDTFGPFAGNPNARVIVGDTEDGTEVHLRLVDDPTPGGGEPGTLEGDMVFLEIGGSTVLTARNIELGNIQLHLNCRGPK